MSDSLTTLREHVRGVILERLDQGDDRRKEAVYEFLSVTMSTDHNTMDRIADLVPPLLPKLYEKWVGMFVERFFETVPQDQIEHLCDGSDQNNAALMLIYIMFLESERMEKQMDADMREYGMKMTGSDDMGDVAADYIRAKMTQLGKSLKGPKDN